MVYLLLLFIIFSFFLSLFLNCKVFSKQSQYQLELLSTNMGLQHSFYLQEVFLCFYAFHLFLASLLSVLCQEIFTLSSSSCPIINPLFSMVISSVFLLSPSSVSALRSCPKYHPNIPTTTLFVFIRLFISISLLPYSLKSS